MVVSRLCMKRAKHRAQHFVKCSINADNRDEVRAVEMVR